MRAFAYERPGSVEELLHQKAHWGDRASILAGGQSLLNMMKLRLAAPEALIDAGRLAELREIKVTEHAVQIGSMATYTEVGTAVAARIPIFTDAIAAIADIQVRNCGTVGGSCSLADPYTDMPNVIMTLAAEFTVADEQATRECSAADFICGPYQTCLSDREALLAISVPLPAPASGAAYEKFAWRRGDYAIASAAVSVRLGSDSRIAAATVVLGSLGTGPFKATTAEAALLGATPVEDALAEAADVAARECAPMGHPIFGSAEYKRAVVATTVKRALERAVHRACQPKAESAG